MLGSIRIGTDLDPAKYDYNISSVFHGLLMEQAEPDYGELLHQSQLKPYSQYLMRTKENQMVWVINCLNEEFYQKVGKKLVDPELSQVFIRHKDLVVNLKGKETDFTSYPELVAEHYSSPAKSRNHRLRLLTPMGFKSGGRYEILPDLRLMFQSIMRRFDAFSDGYHLFDKEALVHLTEHCHITSYRLSSSRFHVEGTTIPAMIGQWTTFVQGPSVMNDLVSLLMAYATYSGIGIKTAMGMGAVSLVPYKRS